MKDSAGYITFVFLLSGCVLFGLKPAEAAREANSPVRYADTSARKMFQPAPESSNYFAEATANGRFYWPTDRGPLKVFIDDGGKTRGYRAEFRKILAEAFTNWCHVTGDTLQWTECNDANEANIRCEWVASREALGASAAYGEAGSAAVHAVENGKDFELDRVTVKLLTQGPSSNGSIQPFSNSQMRSLALHEVGHALGLQGHSADSGDVMYGAAAADDISARDVQTIRMLYEGRHGSSSTEKVESTRNAADRSAALEARSNSTGELKQSAKPSDSALQAAKRELDQNPGSLEARMRVSHLLCTLGSRAEKANDSLAAELRYKSAYDIWREPDAEECDEKIRAVEAFGMFLARQKRAAEAEPLLEECLRRLSSSANFDSQRITADATVLASCYRASGDREEARNVEQKYRVQALRRDR